MRILIAAVGRLKAGPDRELFERYWSRLAQSGRGVGLAPISLIEVPEGAEANVGVRTSHEAARLLAAVPAGSQVVVLDERGKSLSSMAFARLIGQQRDDGVKALAFLVGGPDGHGEPARAAASRTLSLGPLTLPHGLARIVLAEQLYRSATILAGHPYHRE